MQNLTGTKHPAAGWPKLVPGPGLKLTCYCLISFACHHSLTHDIQGYNIKEGGKPLHVIMACSILLHMQSQAMQETCDRASTNRLATCLRQRSEFSAYRQHACQAVSLVCCSSRRAEGSAIAQRARVHSAWKVVWPRKHACIHL